ncbi:MAG: hypothetical protein O7E50_04015, partial [Gemmatimonadetes bacterium]|nr:hypothetical protein [Gemmatimonadota bacterium]
MLNPVPPRLSGRSTPGDGADGRVVAFLAPRLEPDRSALFQQVKMTNRTGTDRRCSVQGDGCAHTEGIRRWIRLERGVG